MDKIGAETINAWWFDPGKGEATFIEKIPARETRKFKPSSSGLGNDWALVPDDASKNFKTPGS